METAKMVELVKLAQLGNQQAMQALYTDRFKPVYFLACKILQNPQDAQDLTQEVFITAFQKLPTLREPEAFYRWLNLITANKCSNFLRKKREFLGDDQDTAAQDTRPEEEHIFLPEPSLDNTETRRMILEVIENLPPKQKACIFYYYYEQMTIAQISENMQCSEGTVKSRLATARGKIRQQLEDKNKNEGIKLYGIPLALTPLLQQAMKEFTFPQIIQEQIWTQITSSIGFSSPATSQPAPQTQNQPTGQNQPTSPTANNPSPIPSPPTPQPAPFLKPSAAFTQSPKNQVVKGVGAGAKKGFSKLPLIIGGASVAVVTVITVTVLFFTGFFGNKISTTPIEWANPAMESVARKALKKPVGTITEENLANITELCILGDSYYGTVFPESRLTIDFIEEKQVTLLDGTPIPTGNFASLQDIEHFVNLEYLYIECNQIADLTPLSSLKNLTTLSLPYNQIQDITPIGQLTKLEFIDLMSNQISDISPLNNLPLLESANFEYNQISSFPNLSKATKLEAIYLDDNSISDLTPLTRLPQLTELTINSNNVSDISVLAQLPNLYFLNIDDNGITDISILGSLSKLEILHASHNQISDISPLESLPSLSHLYITHNQISDLSPLINGFPSLTKIYVSNNNIVDGSPLLEVANLQYLAIDNNPLEDRSYENMLPPY